MHAIAGALLAITVLASGGEAPEPSANLRSCPAEGRVSLAAENQEVRDVLRTIAEQSRFNIAFEPRLRGRVTLSLKCVGAHVALKLIAGQVGAAICYEGKSVHMRRRRDGASNGTCGSSC